MNHRERVNAVLHYQSYDRLPLVSFGYWVETLDKWAAQGHIAMEDAYGYRKDGNNAPADRRVMAKLGFDYNWCSTAGGNSFLLPPFTVETLETKVDGSRVIRNAEGLIEKVNDSIVSIPAMIGTSLTGRDAWEELYLPKLHFSADRVDADRFRAIAKESGQRQYPLGLQVGSLYGNIRNMLGVEELSYLAVDDEELYGEIIDTIGNLCYQVTETVLSFGVVFDYAHYWEDICYKNGPLVNPAVFQELVAPHYARIGKLLNGYGIDITSVDCDGCVDLLVPIWLESGVNTMFPIEVGTWNASIRPWRELYGSALRGVGGMDKRVFAQNKAAVDAEIERLKPLVDLGGYIPCPDHLIPPDADFGNTAYYCEAFRKAFG